MKKRIIIRRYIKPGTAGSSTRGGQTTQAKLVDKQKLEAIMLTHQHYDHIKDIPIIAISLFNNGSNIDVYSIGDVHSCIEEHFLNGKVYPKFQELPREKPTIVFHSISPCEKRKLNGYEILAVPVKHYNGTIGYQVSDNAGKTIFYTQIPGLVW